MARIFCLAACALACAAAGAARADEIFVGGYAHDVDDFISSKGVERGQDIEVGYRGAVINELAGIGRPMFFIQWAGNDARRTSFGAIGFVWRRDLIKDRLYGQIGVGLALHDGYDKLPDPYMSGLSQAVMEQRLYLTDNFKPLGTRILFEPQMVLGWRLSSRLALEASWVHISNAGLASVNPGLDDFGGRVVWRFGPRRW